MALYKLYLAVDEPATGTSLKNKVVLKKLSLLLKIDVRNGCILLLLK